jgi:hypothetical protein
MTKIDPLLSFCRQAWSEPSRKFQKTFRPNFKEPPLRDSVLWPILPRPRSRLQRSVDLGYKQSQPFGPKNPKGLAKMRPEGLPWSRLQRSVDLGYKQSQPFGPKNPKGLAKMRPEGRPRSCLQRSVDLGYKQSQPFGPKEP